jgi:hypothetical protein
MILEIIYVLKVVDIIYDHFELLLLFKLVGHIETFDPLRIKVVHDDFCISQLLPHGPSFLKEHRHAIRPGKSIKIWQLFASKA